MEKSKTILGKKRRFEILNHSEIRLASDEQINIAIKKGNNIKAWQTQIDIKLDSVVFKSCFTKVKSYTKSRYSEIYTCNHCNNHFPDSHKKLAEHLLTTNKV